MKKKKLAIISCGVILCALVGTLIMKPMFEDPPSVLTTPVYYTTIC